MTWATFSVLVVVEILSLIELEARRSSVSNPWPPMAVAIAALVGLVVLAIA